jgi:alpha-tubulin suppressor-like RCC1 family protein
MKTFASALVGLAGAALSACNSLDTAEPTGNVISANAVRLAVGETTTCALTERFGVYCFGENSNFWQQGIDPTSAGTTGRPRVANLPGIASLAGGHGQHMCGFTVIAVGRCWGRGNNGQIGSGGGAVVGNPISDIAGAMFWKDISAGRVHTCGVTTSNVAYCWGLNQRGEGGTTTRDLNSTSTLPIAVDGGLAFKAVSAGWQHACALTTTGAAYCWGDNRSGQLGIGAADTVPKRSPVAVVGTLVFEQLSLGANYSCGITTAHVAYCWGDNSTGELGDGTTTARAVPTLVSGSLKFARIATSTGFGAGSTAPLPAGVLAGNVAHTCALTEAGAPWCWGWNGAGQLGNGSTVDQLVPVEVSGGLKLKEIALGGAHTCGMQGNAIWCWGGAGFGQLGNGASSVASVLIPRAVMSPFNVE